MLKLIWATLKRDVEYHRHGVKVVIPADTQVQVDVENGVGHWNGEAFDLFRDEYCLTN